VQQRKKKSDAFGERLWSSTSGAGFSSAKWWGSEKTGLIPEGILIWIENAIEARRELMDDQLNNTASQTLDKRDFLGNEPGRQGGCRSRAVGSESTLRGGYDAKRKRTPSRLVALGVIRVRSQVLQTFSTGGQHKRTGIGAWIGSLGKYEPNGGAGDRPRGNTMGEKIGGKREYCLFRRKNNVWQHQIAALGKGRESVGPGPDSQFHVLKGYEKRRKRAKRSARRGGGETAARKGPQCVKEHTAKWGYSGY